VRIIIKEVKKHSIACVACRKRKTRCSGSFPCVRCTSKGIECVFTHNKKRGPPAKKNLAVITTKAVKNSKSYHISPIVGEAILGANSEQTCLLDAYYDLVGAGLPLVSNYAGLSKPTTPVLQMQQFAILAFMHGASGQNDKATQLIGQARVLAGSLFDDFSLSSASGFLLMSLYFQDIDPKLASYYAGVGRNISQLCELNNDEERFVQSIVYFASNILDHTIPATQRLAFIKGALPPVTTENVTGLPSIVALMIIFYVATLLETKIGNIVFSPNVNEIISRTTSFELEEEEQIHIMQYLEAAEAITSHHQVLLRNMHSGYLFIIHSLRVVVETLSGNPQQTVDSVSRMINTVGSTSTPSHLKVTLYKDMGLMDVMLALLCRSGYCDDLVYSVRNIVDGSLIPNLENFNLDNTTTNILDELALLEEKLLSSVSTEDAAAATLDGA